MKLPKFTVRHLLISTALIAIGIKGTAISTSTPRMRFQNAEATDFFWTVVWLASGAAIGAGLLSPFRRKLVGAIIGALIYWLPIILKAHRE